MSDTRTRPQATAAELTADQLDLVCGGIIIVGGKVPSGGDATVLSYGGAVPPGVLLGGIAHLGGHVI
jgi:hypothetical protein